MTFVIPINVQKLSCTNYFDSDNKLQYLCNEVVLSTVTNISFVHFRGSCQKHERKPLNTMLYCISLDSSFYELFIHSQFFSACHCMWLSLHLPQFSNRRALFAGPLELPYLIAATQTCKSLKPINLNYTIYLYCFYLRHC